MFLVVALTTNRSVCAGVLCKFRLLRISLSFAFDSTSKRAVQTSFADVFLVLISKAFYAKYFYHFLDYILRGGKSWNRKLLSVIVIFYDGFCEVVYKFS